MLQMRLLDCRLHAAAQSEPLRACIGMVLMEVGDIAVHSPGEMRAAIQATGQRHADNSIAIDLHFVPADVVDKQEQGARERRPVAGAADAATQPVKRSGGVDLGCLE